MGSLRLKLTLALVGMSVVAIAAVGGFARWFTVQRFDDLVVQRAAEGFIGEVSEYYQAYGSWDAARAAEPFTEFVRRARPGMRLVGGGVRPGPGPGPGRSGGGTPPPQRAFDLGGSPPAFFVVDADGRVVLDLAGRTLGDRADPAEMAGARPIDVEGTTVGFAVAAERPALTAFENRYLEAIQSAWIYSLLLAGVLAIPVGLVLGRHFSAPVRELTQAIARMRGGALHQSVRVRSRDEFGQMASAFNSMSEELASTYAELERSRARLRDLSRQDELTGLPNRRDFNERVPGLLAQARRYGRPLTLALADVDHFKRVNDEFSHATGDQVLREVARLIDARVREVDLVARYGGEEFVIAFPETDLESAAALADRLREMVAGHEWQRLAPGLAVTFSAGLAEVEGDATAAETLAEADAKLYEAKAGGRNQVRY